MTNKERSVSFLKMAGSGDVQSAYWDVGQAISKDSPNENGML